jgi:CheY-like chemotaxis protein
MGAMTADIDRKIVLVEDTPDSVEVLTEYLQRLCDDIQVCSFLNGPEFLKTFQPGLYRVAVLDLSMPGMDGFEVLRRIRLIDPTLPAIALTAHAGQGMRDKAAEAGFDDFITKPIHDLDASVAGLSILLNIHPNDP